jgi:hypothetical protein
MRTDGETDMTTLIVAFRNCLANAPKDSNFSHTVLCMFRNNRYVPNNINHFVFVTMRY